MRSARSATIVCGLALWAVLALAPLVGACLDGSCARPEGLRSAHCGMPATAMLCCDETPEQPAAASVEVGPRAPIAVTPSRSEAAKVVRCEEPAPEVARSSHGPPLYALFDSLLI